jgi:AraC family transcriptional regulator of adaptative response/methylated-DNA-[protein]-cysteine methyltransferase
MSIHRGDYDVVERAIKFIEESYTEQPSLDEIAEYVHLSKYHFQRVFSRWAGISPKKFMQYLTVSHAKKLLAESKSVLDVTYEVGLSSAGRLHDLFVNFEALSPGEYKLRGKGLQIEYSFCGSPFGTCLLAKTERGICWMSFLSDNSRSEALADMLHNWDGARCVENDGQLKLLAERVFRPFEGGTGASLQLHIRGTNFQVKVWEALLAVPFGRLASYGDIAAKIGAPSASRAVGGAVGSNPVALLIPCHRVIRETGVIGNYRWGEMRKRLLIGWEAVHSASLRQDSPHHYSSVQNHSL